MDDLKERLAAIEHQRWADWQRYVHRLCGHPGNAVGYEIVIPPELVDRWERQIATPYAELTEAEKESDREQVDRYWPLIADLQAKLAEAQRDAEQMRLVLAAHGQGVDPNGYYAGTPGWRLRRSRDELKAAIHPALHDLDVRINGLDVGACHCNLVAEVVLDAIHAVDALAAAEQSTGVAASAATTGETGPDVETTGERCGSCGGTRWVDDEGWQPEDYEIAARSVKRMPGAGRIPCGICNHGGWNVPDGQEFERAIAESERQIRASIPLVGPTFEATMARLDANRPALPLKAKTVRKPSQDVIALDEDHPPLTDLIGLDPDFTDGLSTEEYKRATNCGGYEECKAVEAERDELKAQRDKVLAACDQVERLMVELGYGESKGLIPQIQAIYADSRAGQAGQEVGRG